MKNTQFDSPTVVIIFGVTGDLSRKKLLPSLFDMFRRGYLPTVFRVVGFSRQSYSDENFQAFVRDALREKKSVYQPDELASFLKIFSYQQGTFEDALAYTQLSQTLLTIDGCVGQCTSKLFYLAVPPTFYEVIFHNLAQSGLTIPCDQNLGWTRVLVEKPFGKDLKTAQELDILLGKLFQERQIFRIDHYLAKETIQNILTFRFSNIIFEPIWNREWIEKVDIKLWEDIDVSTRGAFYDDVGALRDVGQNHMLQMLALIAMEHPGELHADAIRAKRADVMKQLMSGDISQNVVRGQYEGFTDTIGVKKDSDTETYFRLKTFIDNDRWQGVPFYLESGKALKEKKVEIIVTFKPIHPCFCPLPHASHTHQNTLTFTIQPEEKITVRFFTRQQGIRSNVVEQDLSFDYAKIEEQRVQTDAYEKVLFDCIVGDQTLFASTEELRASWSFITPLLEEWHTLALEVYPRGSLGPEKTL